MSLRCSIFPPSHIKMQQFFYGKVETDVTGRDRRNNWAALTGDAVREPAFSHNSGGEDYFRFPLRCRRLSGAEDLLQVVVSRSLLERRDIRAGDRLSLRGTVRSWNNRTGQGNRLVITVRAARLLPEPPEEDDNQVRLTGNLCKVPVYRRTPLGREIADLLLAVNGRCGRADYLPCIAWGALARQAARWQVGDRVRLRGRLQSRAYIKVVGEERVEKVAYEVSAMALERVLRAAEGQNSTGNSSQKFEAFSVGYVKKLGINPANSPGETGEFSDDVWKYCKKIDEKLQKREGK